MRIYALNGILIIMADILFPAGFGKCNDPEFWKCLCRCFITHFSLHFHKYQQGESLT